METERTTAATVTLSHGGRRGGVEARATSYGKEEDPTGSTRMIDCWSNILVAGYKRVYDMLLVGIEK